MQAGYYGRIDIPYTRTCTIYIYIYTLFPSPDVNNNIGASYTLVRGLGRCLFAGEQSRNRLNILTLLWRYYAREYRCSGLLRARTERNPPQPLRVFALLPSPHRP